MNALLPQPGGFEGFASHYRFARFCLWARATISGVKMAWSNTKQISSTSPGTTAPARRSATPVGTIAVQNQKYSFMPSGSEFSHRHMPLMLRRGSVYLRRLRHGLDPQHNGVGLAGSGLESLLPQPGGFEGRGPIGEVADRSTPARFGGMANRSVAGRACGVREALRGGDDAVDLWSELEQLLGRRGLGQLVDRLGEA